MIDAGDKFALLNCWIQWASGCLRMPTFVKGMTRWQFHVQGVDPVDGASISVRASGPTVGAALADLMRLMEVQLSEPVFLRGLGLASPLTSSENVDNLGGTAGGGMGGGRGSAPSLVVPAAPALPESSTPSVPFLGVGFIRKL